MTIPMPYTEAPPHPGRSPKFSGDDVGHEERLAAREAWDDARWKYTESIVVGRDKRLTDAECAAHEWQAASTLGLALYAPAEVLGVDIPEDGNMYSWERPDAEPLNRAYDTWLRFATHPHAPEEA